MINTEIDFLEKVKDRVFPLSRILLIKEEFTFFTEWCSDYLESFGMDVEDPVKGKSILDVVEVHLVEFLFKVVSILQMNPTEFSFDHEIGFRNHEFIMKMPLWFPCVFNCGEVKFNVKEPENFVFTKDTAIKTLNYFKERKEDRLASICRKEIISQRVSNCLEKAIKGVLNK